MRREPYGTGSIIHVVKRGARGIPFLKNDTDRHRLLLMFTHFNDKPSRPFWFNDLLAEDKVSTFERAESWPDTFPLTKIHAFCIHDNHLHILLEEIMEGGISLFMQKIGNGLSGFLNEKYHEYGSPFQGAYKSKTIDNDVYLRYVITYIQVKNTLEQFPGGYRTATEQFNEAYEWALQFPYSSLHDHLGRSDLPKRGIVSSELFLSMWTPKEYKKYAEDVILGRAHLGTDDKNAFRGAFI